MKVMAIVVRKLKEGKTYEDFRRRWYHTVGFGVPTQMYSVVNAADPREVITIGIIDTPLEKIGELVAIDAEQRKTLSLDDIIESSIIRYFGPLVAQDDFSAAGQLSYRPAQVDGVETDLNALPTLLDAIIGYAKSAK